MKAAFSTWNGRIAPVFDVARQVQLVEAEAGAILHEASLILPEADQAVRVARLAELGVETLVCGAISRPLHLLVESYGIQVLPFLAGELSGVVTAWLQGALEDQSFAMPGCCGPGRRRSMRNRQGAREDEPRQGGNRRGRNQPGPSAGAAEFGFCICPHCGHREPHSRGIPCLQRQCPQCGTALVRE